MKKLIKLMSLLAIFSAFGTNLLAQNMNEDFRKTAPAPLAPVPFNIPKPFETTLPNGLKIVIFEDKRLPLVSYRLAFPIGDINDPKDNIGLTSAVISLIDEGTKHAPANKLPMKRKSSVQVFLRARLPTTRSSRVPRFRFIVRTF